MGIFNPKKVPKTSPNKLFSEIRCWWPKLTKKLKANHNCFVETWTEISMLVAEANQKFESKSQQRSCR